MKQLARIVVVVGLSLGTLTACGKDKAQEEESDKPEQKIPPEASNGSPVAVEFVKFEGEGEERGLELHVYNFGDKTAASYTFLLRYYDGDDKLLKVKPGTPFEKDHDFTSMSGGRYKCASKGHANLELDGRMLGVPAEAVRVEVLASKVDAIAADGKTIEDWWSQENWSEWPSE